MHAWESIQQVVDYIEENLTEELSIEVLAQVASLSPFYFQRLFRRLVKTPVRDYARMRRLAKACELLQNTDQTVLDIAEEYHFSGHANFTRAFRKAFGITPDELRHTHIMLNQYVKPDLLLNYVMVDEEVPLIAEGIVLEVVRKRLANPKTISGIAREIPISDIMGGRTSGVSATGALWNDFHQQKSSIEGLLQDGIEYGVLFVGHAKEGNCMYLAGAEAHTESADTDSSLFAMPVQEYIVYSFEAESFHELVTAAEYKAQTFMKRWMEMHGLQAGGFAVSFYFPAHVGSAYMETWLDFRPLGEMEAD